MTAIFSLPWLKEKSPLTIAVVGDVILDEYLDGSVYRISPEAPVPVHTVLNSFQTAGGAANAARNIQAVGGKALLASVCGDDETSKQLEFILNKDGIDSSCLVKCDDRPTTKKARVTANHQQLLRIDWEKAHPIHKKQQDKLYEKLEQNTFSVLLISDYGKGTLPREFLARLIKLANDRSIPCIVDPKGKDFSRYQGSDLITPNTKEACEALGLDIEEGWSGEELGRKLQKNFGLSNVLVTMGSKGMAFTPKTLDKNSISIKPKAREVFDVSGAGDTTVAIMALGLASGLDYEEAMQIANTAAGLVVEKWGTQPVFQNELEEALWNERLHPTKGQGYQSKIIKREILKSILQSPSIKKKKVVFTNGCFDILHAGHVTYLEKAKAKGDILVIGINSDESIKRIKGASRPLIPLEQRQTMLAALQCVDFVVSFSDDTPLSLIEYLQPDILIKGSDYQEKNIVGAEFVKNTGGAVEVIDLVPGISTTEIIRRARNENN
ncbi:MAG: D-glycero-beta-D-manno-heptose 1-phosphate adenylyltransferase [Bdellovibrionota bacterium]